MQLLPGQPNGGLSWQTCRCSKLGNQMSPFIVNKVQLETNGFIVYMCTVQGEQNDQDHVLRAYYPSVVLNARSVSIVFTCLPSSFIYLFLLLWWWFFFWLYASALWTTPPSGIVCTAFYLQIRNDDKRVLLRRNKRHLYCKYVAGFFDPSVLVAISLRLTADWCGLSPSSSQRFLYCTL